VQPGSELDRIARKRGTSTYLPGRVLPMLPEALSNDACSLIEGQRRLAIVCEMLIGHDGVTKSQRIFEATIVSRKRLSYDSAQALLDAGDNSDHVTAQLQTLNALRAALFERRRTQFLAMEERPDFKLETDADGRLTAIQRIDRNDAHRIVEECMLAANRAACDFLLQHKLPALFIAHAGFRAERHDHVRQLIASQYPEQKDIAFNELSGYIDLIRHIEQHPTDVPVYTLLSRQLERSQISTSPAPHFGMGLPCYTTITSPIRKYHDLCVHRVIKAFLHSQKIVPPDSKLPEQLQEASQRARQSSRELEQWLKCIYLQPHVGRQFRGEITQIGSRHIGVYLEEFDCIGHVDVKALNEKFQFDAVTSELRNGDKVLRLHQKLDVALAAVDVGNRQITLLPVAAAA
jgi:ribonuclease R